MTEEQEIIEAERVYLNFLDNNIAYQDRIINLISKNERRLIIDLNDLRAAEVDRVEKLLSCGFIEISAFQNALKKCITNINPDYGNKYEEFFVGFKGSYGARQLTPRTLTCDFLGNMVCIEGIITKTSIIKSKIVHSVHYCPATNKFLERHYNDVTSINPFPSAGAYPTKDEAGNILETEYGLSVYKDTQTLVIQEMPETTPTGQLPRSIEVVLDNDLVDSCKSGDRVYISGQYRCMPGKKGGFTTGTFRTILIANNIYPINTRSATTFEGSNFIEIRKMAKKPDIVDILTRSIAPSICGNEFIKRAVLCQLLGGVERILINGTRIRGDINILLLGDPSVAKSQFLRFVLQCARDRAIATTGRGSSGVGLTAAVVTDRDTGERGLEAGAMVLADRGIVCIDEFDKMSDIDRTAIHEVMEQGRVTIAKAGIHAKLNARCSVLAAANPVYGRYDQYKTPMDNIGLQDSLLSRFDLLFIILDQHDEVADRAIAEFVRAMHMYRPFGQEDGEPLPFQNSNKVDYEGGDSSMNKICKIFEQSIHRKPHVIPEEYFTKEFLEMYIYVARQFQPELSKEASNILHEKYCDLRSQEAEILANGTEIDRCQTQPVTARTMETLIRLATAHAKARLKKVVSAKDAEAAADLVSYVIFKGTNQNQGFYYQDLLKKTRKRSSPIREIAPFRNRLKPPRKKIRTRIRYSEEEEQQPAVEEIDEESMMEFTYVLSDIFDEAHNNFLKLSQLITQLQARLKRKSISSRIMTFLDELALNNHIMLEDDVVYVIGDLLD